MAVSQYNHVVPYTDPGGRGYFGVYHCSCCYCGPEEKRHLMRHSLVHNSCSYCDNSHIRHSGPGCALLRSRIECGRLWVLLGSAVQAGPHTQSGMCIINCSYCSYQFLPEISSFVITCTYLFTTDDNHLQKSTLLSSVICHYTGHQQSLHQPKFDQFFLKIWAWNHMEVLRYKAAIV